MIYFGLCLPALSAAISCSLIESRAIAQNVSHIRYVHLLLSRQAASELYNIFGTDQPRLRCQAALMCRPGFLVQVRSVSFAGIGANSVSWPFAWKSLRRRRRRLPLSITISIIIAAVVSCIILSCPRIRSGLGIECLPRSPPKVECECECEPVCGSSDPILLIRSLPAPEWRAVFAN